jgi:hypothetical protein
MQDRYISSDYRSRKAVQNCCAHADCYVTKRVYRGASLCGLCVPDLNLIENKTRREYMLFRTNARTTPLVYKVQGCINKFFFSIPPFSSFSYFFSKSRRTGLNITNRSKDHLARTTSASRMRVTILAASSPEPGKAYHSRICYSKHTESRRTKAPNNRRTRAATIVKNDACRDPKCQS